MIERVVFGCDLGPTLGTGHVMRCIALAEELAHRQVRCEFVADFASVPWVARQVTERGFDLHPHAGGLGAAPDAVLGRAPDAVVLDSYEAPAALSDAIRTHGTPLLAIVDGGETRGHRADVYVDQFAADDHPAHDGSTWLAGLGYALVRDEVLRHRPALVAGVHRDRAPQVLAYFGGTDAYGAGPAVAVALAATGRPFAATVIAPRPELRTALEQVPLRPGQRIDVIDPPPSLMALVADADLVVSAAGTSLVELSCVGAAAAAIAVVDNQRCSYDLAVGRGLAAGLGDLADLREQPDHAVAVLAGLLDDPGRRRRLRERAWSAVDGRGRERVADVLLHRTHVLHAPHEMERNR